VLRALGCEFGRGYRFSRPIPAAQLLPLLLAQVETVASAS
jgi:EAL domain-containing protein (putative c-di-GMP-specific phosphodiesterase class I)